MQAALNNFTLVCFRNTVTNIIYHTENRKIYFLVLFLPVTRQKGLIAVKGWQRVLLRQSHSSLMAREASYRDVYRQNRPLT